MRIRSQRLGRSGTRFFRIHLFLGGEIWRRFPRGKGILLFVG